MASVFARFAFVKFLLEGVGVAHGLSLSTALKADLAPSTSGPIGAPPTEKDVMAALANVNASLSTVEEAINTANSTAYSIAENALQSIADFQDVLGSLTTKAGKQSSLSETQENQTTLLVDTVGRSVETAEANVSTNLDAFSTNLSAIMPPLYAMEKQITTQFLEALTMAEDIHNVSQSQGSLDARQAAKRAARKAVRDLKAPSDDTVDKEDAPPQQVGALRRLVDKFGWESAKRILRRAASKLHGNKPQDDVSEEETSKATNLMVGSGLASDDNSNATAEDFEAQTLLEGHVLADLGVDSPDDLEAALMRKGPADIDRQDMCAQATQKIYHANKTLHRLSKKFVGVKTTVHQGSVVSVDAGVAAIDSINSTATSSLAEFSEVPDKPLAKGIRKLSKVRFHMGQFAQPKTLILDAVSTLTKTAPLAENLRSVVDDACLSGACGEEAQQACEASTA